MMADEQLASGLLLSIFMLHTVSPAALLVQVVQLSITLLSVLSGVGMHHHGSLTARRSSQSSCADSCRVMPHGGVCMRVLDAVCSCWGGRNGCSAPLLYVASNRRAAADACAPMVLLQVVRVSLLQLLASCRHHGDV
jgi:hypothetical protein